MTQIRCARPDEYQTIMRFLEDAFKHPADFFPHTYPMTWRQENTDYSRIFMITEQDRIASMLRVFPLQLALGEVRVRVGGIGAVATAPAWRGKGHMDCLMRHALDEI